MENYLRSAFASGYKRLCIKNIGVADFIRSVLIEPKRQGSGLDFDHCRRQVPCISDDQEERSVWLAGAPGSAWNTRYQNGPRTFIVAPGSLVVVPQTDSADDQSENTDDNGDICPSIVLGVIDLTRFHALSICYRLTYPRSLLCTHLPCHFTPRNTQLPRSGLLAG